MGTYSIALRLRRVIYEDAYIAVPVTDAILRKVEDGALRIDPEAMVAEGLRVGQDPRVEWQVESTTVEAHSIQQASPEGRKKLDTYYDAPEGS